MRGVQSRDVATTPKHLAGNEAELDRYTMSSVIDERALRELYLVPFELAVREGGALGIMTAYNRLNGGYCTEDEALLAGILRGEWGFEGFVVSDWFGARLHRRRRRAPGSTSRCPGRAASTAPRWPTPCARARSTRRCWTPRSAACSACSTASARSTTTRTRPERSEDRPEHRALAREAAADSFVLLRNEGLLPLDAGGLRSLAVIGPNADRAQVMGGGSAKLRAHYSVTPLEALRERAAGRRDPPRARLRHRPHARPSCAPPGGSRSRAPDQVAERDSGLLLFDAAIGAETGRYTARAELHARPRPGRTRSRCARPGARGCWSAARSCSTASRTRRRAARR